MRVSLRYILYTAAMANIWMSCQVGHTVQNNWYGYYNFKKNSNQLIETTDSSYKIYRLASPNADYFSLSAYGSLQKIQVLDKTYLIFRDSILNQPSVRIYADSKKDSLFAAHDSMQIVLVNNFLNPRYLKMYLFGPNDTVIINNYSGRIGKNSFQIKSGVYNRFYIETPFPDPYILDYTLRSNVLNFDMNFNGIVYVKMESTYSALNKEPGIDFLNNDTAIVDKKSILDFRKPTKLKYKKVNKGQFNKFYKKKFLLKSNL